MRRGKRKNKIIGTLIALVLVIIASFLGLEQTKDENNITEQVSSIVTDGNLQVYYLDVGQADSIFIQCEGKNMLIDAGTNEMGSAVVQFLKSRNITKLDYVVGTHPHEDHIGGLDDVIRSFEIGQVFMPEISTNTKTFEDVLDAIAAKNLKVTSPEIGDKFSLGQANIEVMSSIIEKDNLNLSSIVLRLTYGKNSFLFMGDAEMTNEEQRNWPQTQILKVGHHGSNTSSSEEFLKQVKPEVAIISVGEDNSYGHPNKEIIDRFTTIGALIYRTDLDGTIYIHSDGEKYEVKKLEKIVNE